MADAAGLKYRQQKTIIRYLTHFFGHLFTVPQEKLFGLGKDFVAFKIFYEKIGGVEVKYMIRDSSKMLQHYISSGLTDGDAGVGLIKADISLGGDHGKGSFTFLLCLHLRYTDTSKDRVLDIQIGEIESSADSVELLKPLVKQIEEGVKCMNPDENGNSFFVVVDDQGKKNLQFEKFAGSIGVVVIDVPLAFYMMGDLKFLFMMLGRDGFSGSHCMYCMYKQSEWVTKHTDDGLCDCGGERWSIKKLHDKVFYVKRTKGRSHRRSQIKIFSTGRNRQKKVY
jgi:hypothetical protein